MNLNKKKETLLGSSSAKRSHVVAVKNLAKKGQKVMGGRRNSEAEFELGTV